MATYRLPVSSTDPHYSIVVDLDGANFDLAFSWSERAEFWHLSIAQDDGTKIADGIKCVVGLPLLTKLSSDIAPQGDLIFVDTSGDDIDPGRDDLGARVLLYYLDAEDAGAA